MADPLGDNEMQRVCHGCVNPNKCNGSSADSAAGAASSKRPCPEGEGTGKGRGVVPSSQGEVGLDEGVWVEEKEANYHGRLFVTLQSC